MHSSRPSVGVSACLRGVISRLNTCCSFPFCVILILSWPTTQQSLIFAEPTAPSDTYKLGFLSPIPGNNIPASLAEEWRSAFLVALDVLNRNRSYTILPLVEDSECSSLSEEQAGAERMLRQESLIGAVGPACSNAAISAARVFDSNGPAALVSFAATAEPLSNRAFYPTLFRTVYSDIHQAMAIAASMVKLQITNATLLYTEEFYSTNLATNINETVGGVRMIRLEPGDANATVNKEQLTALLNSLQPSDFVILAVQPTVAEDIWRVAFEMGKTRYPWWYFGTDGATAFDPADVDADLVDALRGEIGLAPFGGDFSEESTCFQFFNRWKEMEDHYPGLPAMGINKSRSYVPFLFDAVTAFYEVLDGLLAADQPFTKENVYMSFNASGLHRISFKGCTGVVEFDPETGARSVDAQEPIYDLVALSGHSWELRGRIDNATYVALQPLERPGIYPAPGQEHYGLNPNGRKRASGGLIAGIVFLVIAIIVLIVACFVYYAKKKHNLVFVRIT